ncbi:hypothetical protein MHC_01195 [Mycoplasma haemocanis str. Illinois]|uniref:Uncharacterized protein n=1 Tax=Mycoplasma haemocanis (strain Illinois) TaxID=1111676 RepID=H6N633_MYCHN|nr:hypothetical protein [Mycoplasma haemocanis]AEW45105.1 hypothetical protein MHC_01195 [Mycoplasma haemocanis str. Illinois]
MSAITKGVVSLLSVGGVGVIGTGIYLLKPFKTKKVSINDILRKQEIFTLLKGEDAKWAEAWKNYQSKNKGKKKGEDTWKLTDWVGDSSSIGDPFKNECNKRLSLEVSGEEDPLFKEFKEMCMRKTTVTDKLEKEGYEFLKVDDSNNSLWTANFQAYKNAKPEEKVAGIDIGQSEIHSNNSHLTKFKNACQSSVAKAIDEVSYSNTKRWCAKKK